MGYKNGRTYCCDCDYCARGRCEGLIIVVFFVARDNPTKATSDYIQFCRAHVTCAIRGSIDYLDKHPALMIDPEQNFVTEWY